MDSNKTDGYMVTDRDGMLQVLRGLYCSFEKSHSILQIAGEDGSYEDDYIAIIDSIYSPVEIYYKMKRIPEWY